MNSKTLRSFTWQNLWMGVLFKWPFQLYCQQPREVDTTFSEASKTFLAVPLVSNSPVMKIGFGGLGMYFFKADKGDTESPPSLVSPYAIYTTNNSYIFTPFGRFFWNHDKNRASLGFGTLRVNNDFI